MRRLLVLRHAKSSWDDPDLDDHERPLAARGRRAAEAIADHVLTREIDVELVLCSTAVRARQTLAPIAVSLREVMEVRFEEGLYGASAGDLIARVARVPDAVRSVLIVGHNPGLRDLVVALARDPEAGETIGKLPTGALATLALDGGWDELAPGGCELIEFARPRDLERAPGE